MPIYFVSIRVTCDNLPALQDWYVANFERWLEYRNYKIINNTYGVHLNTESPHFHYHLVVEGKKSLSNPLATLKQDYGFGTTSKVDIIYLTNPANFPTSFIGQEYKGKINMSVKITEEKPLTQKRFLQYPLKEGNTDEKHINLHGLPYALDELKAFAKSEYESALLKRKQKEQKEEKTKSEWEELLAHYEKHKPENLGEVYRQTHLYYLENWNKPPTYKFISDQAERYSIKIGLLSVQYLSDKFCQQH